MIEKDNIIFIKKILKYFEVYSYPRLKQNNK